MNSSRKRNLVLAMLELTMLLTILNVSNPFVYATEWFSTPDTRITWDNSLDWAPSIAQAQDGRIYVVWHSFEVVTQPDILCKVYNGSSTFPWSPTKKLTDDPSVVDKTPSVTAADSNIWVVWSSNRDGNFEIYCKIHDGFSWSPDTRLTENASIDEFPSIMQDLDGNIWVVWSSNRTGNFEIHYKIHDGFSWQPCGQLTLNEEEDWDPSITQAQDGKIWLAWIRDTELFYKVLFENMTEAISDTQLSNNETSPHPSITQAQDGKIWIAWESDRTQLGSGMDIYCKTFLDGQWSSERITYDSADDLMPTVMQTENGTTWIAWTSTRLGNFDIYYKTDSLPPHVHDLAIVSVTYDPNVTVAYQGLTISIEVVPQNQGANPENFVVSCYANSTLIGSQTKHLSAGQLMPINFEWNTSNVPPGTYTIIANASINGQTDTDPADNTFIDGEVYVKIPGDVNGNRVVDAFDLFDLSKAYESKPGDPNWNPDCDFNRDNKVDASDLLDLTKNLGKTI